MGAELPCILHVDSTSTRGRALLETDELLFRGGEIRLKIPLRSIRRVDAKDGMLVVRHGASSEARLEIGAQAAKWKEKIENPKGRLDKLGIKAGHRVALVGVDDASLTKELRERGAEIVDGKKDVDVIFLALDAERDLKKLATVQRALARDGAIWTLRAKGRDAPVSEKAAMAAGKAAGLVDVKVARFSETHTAEKWVIPVAKR